MRVAACPPGPVGAGTYSALVTTHPAGTRRGAGRRTPLRLAGGEPEPSTTPSTAPSTELAVTPPPEPDERVVEVRRSARRRRTVSAYREGDRTVVLIPARFSQRQEREWVDTMLQRLAAADQRRRPTDEALTARAADLSRRYLGGAARPASVLWVANQQHRWGSCTPADGTVRISERLRGMPEWVLDYVLLHELAHLLQPSHGPQFWALLESYPRTERARGFLDGVSHATGRVGPGGDPPDDPLDPEEAAGAGAPTLF